MRATHARTITAAYEAKGFRAQHIPFTRTWHVTCDACQVVVVNGHATHETGCPNAMKECRGCNNLILARSWAKYCEDCQ